MMTDAIYRITRGDGPLVATAIHDGHAMRDEVLATTALSAAERLREEDPHTGSWTEIAPTRVVGLRSRFEVDLNRPPEKSVYRKPEDAWGLRVWRGTLPDAIVERSMAEYRAFYAALDELYRGIAERYGKLVVYDIHSYNHRRSGPCGPLADADAHPDVNVGTGTMTDRARWAPLIDRFITDLSAFPIPAGSGLGGPFAGGRLDVRENVKFFGGRMARWTHERFPETACVLSIEFKKFFMDEWSGDVDTGLIAALGEALRSTLPGVLEALRDVR